MRGKIVTAVTVVGLLWTVKGVAAQSPGDPDSAKKPVSTKPGMDAALLGWWKLDEASGKSVRDSSPHGRDGTLSGSATLVPGRHGNALKLDGKGALTIVGFKGVGGIQPRTVAAWIKTTSDRGEIIAWGEDDFGKMWIFGFVRGHVGVVPQGGYLYINDRINDGQWHHVAAVVEEGDPPNLHDHVKLYVDGTVAQIHDIGLLDLWPLDTGHQMDVRIGNGLNGLIDDVRIFGRALGEEEVKAIAQQN